MDRLAYQQMLKVEKNHWWFTGRRAVLERVLHKFKGKKLKILDVGCGTGGNFEFLSDFGAVDGIESDPQSVEWARQKATGKVFCGSFPREVPSLDTYDLVTLFDVLEHIEEDKESLKVLWNYIRPGGHIVVAVPAFSFLWSIHDERLHHKRRYTIPQVENLLVESGFEVLRSTYYNFWLFHIIFPLRVIGRWFMNRDVRSDLEIPPFFLNKTLHFLFKSEAFLIRFFRLPWGVSLVAIGRKP